MITIYPSLQVSANGAVALVDGVADGFKVVSIPDLAVRWAGTYRGVAGVVLSGFGESIGILTTTDGLVVVREGRPQRYDVPRSADRIRAFAIAEAGDRVALALGSETGGDGVLEVWSLPAGEAPLAATALPAIERARVVGNPGFTRIGLVAATGGNGPNFRAVYAVPGDGSGELTPRWTEGGAPLSGTSVALSDEWTWLARDDGLAGWRGDGRAPVVLPGTAFERLIYSPAGSHLLASRVERLAGATGAVMLFRLYDLATLTEVAGATHAVEHDTEAHPVVTAGPSLSVLRATRAGDIAVEHYDLAGSV